MMKYEYRKDFDGNDMLVLDSTSSYQKEITIEGGELAFYIEDGYDSQMVNISLEYWEEIKAFVDSQIDKG